MGCLIRVDPEEMTSTASVLQGIAAELSDVGGGVQSQCGSCCLPNGVEGQVLAQASAVESSLGGIASDLGGQATDLSNRSAVAAGDSLPTASSAAGPGLGSSIAPTASAGSGYGVSVIGGASLYEPIVFNGVPMDPSIAAGLPNGGLVTSLYNNGGTGSPSGSFFDGSGYPPGHLEPFFPGAAAPTSGGQGGAGGLASLNNSLWNEVNHTSLAYLPVGGGNLVL